MIDDGHSGSGPHACVCVCERERGRAVSGRLIKDGGGGEVVVLGGMRFKQPSFD